MSEATVAKQHIFARLLFCILMPLAIPVGSAVAGETLRQTPKPVVQAADLARRIHQYINAERTRQQQVVLRWDPALAVIALKHSRDMAARDYLAHDSPEGKSYLDRYRQGGYTCQVKQGREILLGAENIALGRLYNTVTRVNGVAYFDWNTAQQIARKTVEGWMNSTGHRRNILTPAWRREGIGIEIHPDNKIYITQNFC